MTFCDAPEHDSTSVEARVLNLPDSVPPLRSFYLYLSMSCNLRCRHCWITPEFSDIPAPGKTIDPKALHDAVIEAKTLGLAQVKLTGGEPMLHPQFKEIVDMLTIEDISMNMETNGTLITEEMARYLKEKTNVDFISVSVDSPVAAEHDAFRGVRGAFDAALRGLDYLVDAGYTNCQVIMSVHRGNRDRIEDLARLAAEHRAETVKFNPVTWTGRGVAMHERGETLEFKELVAFYHWVNNELRERSPIPTILPMPAALTPFDELWQTKGRSCVCGIFTTLGILGTGEIALCGIGYTVPELVYGQLGKNSIRKVWLSHPAILQLRRDLDNTREYPGICGSCIHAKSCRTGCVADNYVRCGKLVSPDWLCAEAARIGAFPKTRLREMESDLTQR
ncbi:MAG: radical SAM protein [Halobacteriota archaeon]